MPRPRLTMSQLAAELGVSVATVSNALNGKGRVAPKTRARILAAAHAHGFRTNRLARALRTGRRHVVGIHLPELVDDLSFYMEFAFGASAALSARGYGLLLATDASAAALDPSAIDGLIMVDWARDDRVPRSLGTAGVPVLAAEGVPTDGQASLVVSVDYARITAEMVSQAFDAGAQRPLLVAPTVSTEGSAWHLGITEGYESACASAGFAAERVDFPVGGSVEELEELLARECAERRLDCVVFAGQRLAGLAVTRFGFGVPESDVPWVISCAGDPMTELPDPRITAIDPHPHEYGRRCGELMLDVLADAELPEFVEWPATIAWASEWAPADLEAGG